MKKVPKDRGIEVGIAEVVQLSWGCSPRPELRARRDLSRLRS